MQNATYGKRFLKQTTLHLNNLPTCRPDGVATPDKPAVKIGEQSYRANATIRIAYYDSPVEQYLLSVRGKEYSYATEAECLAFLYGKCGYRLTGLDLRPAELPLYWFNLQLHGQENEPAADMPMDDKSHPVVQHLNTAVPEGGIHPWCIHYRGAGRYFKTFAEVVAYVEGRWGRYIGEENVYA